MVPASGMRVADISKEQAYMDGYLHVCLQRYVGIYACMYVCIMRYR